MGGGGGGVHVNLTKKLNSDSDVCLFLFFCFFLSPRLILQKSNWLISKRNIIFQGSGGGLNFSRGGGGGHLLTSYRNPNNL